MGDNLYPSIRRFYNMICVVAAVYMSIICLETYISDEDVCLVDFKEFHTEPEDVYPTISIIIFNPFYHGRKSIDAASYMQFLEGKTDWNHDFGSIDYDEVSINLSDHLIDYRVWYDDEFFAMIDSHYSIDENKNFKHPTNSLQLGGMKTFAFDTDYKPGKHVQAVEIVLNTTVFGDDELRPPQMDTSNAFRAFGVAFTYPGQGMKTYSNVKYTWPLRKSDSAKYYTMVFSIKRMEVVAYRNKRNNRCIEDWRTIDEIASKKLAQNVGCRPPFFTHLNISLKKCSDSSQLKEYTKQMQRLATKQMVGENWKYHPCRTIKQLQYSYHDIEESRESGITIRVDFRGM